MCARLFKLSHYDRGPRVLSDRQSHPVPSDFTNLIRQEEKKQVSGQVGKHTSGEKYQSTLLVLFSRAVRLDTQLHARSKRRDNLLNATHQCADGS